MATYTPTLPWKGYGPALDREIDTTLSSGARRFILLFAIVALGVTLLYLKSNTIELFSENAFLAVYSFFVTLFVVSRLVSATQYRRSYQSLFPADAHPITHAHTQTYEPNITVVIPCKNEEGAIAHTIQKTFEADYPAYKLEVIVINDGSTDNTLDEIIRMKESFPALTVVDWKENKGKRQGMAEGFRRARGEIVIQLDSDSYIEPGDIRALIAPFQNPDVAAVCAHAEPSNADVNLLTKMQAAYYFMSFRILKAAESTYHTVFCCSGCSSAYRRNAVMPIMEEWLNERFLGLPATWGDDRALTSWVLKQGYKAVYTDEAKAYTIVPEKFRQFTKQQIRWKKSFLVNSVFLSKFIFKRDAFVGFFYFVPLTVVTFLTPIMAFWSLWWSPIVHQSIPLHYLIGLGMICSLMAVYYQLLAPKNNHWPYLFLWYGLSAGMLSFLLFYALATIQNRAWGTR
jgi:hyaluronan synthase